MDHWNATDWLVTLALAYLFINVIAGMTREGKKIKLEKSSQPTGPKTITPVKNDHSDRAA